MKRIARYTTLLVCVPHGTWVADVIGIIGAPQHVPLTDEQRKGDWPCRPLSESSIRASRPVRNWRNRRSRSGTAPIHGDTLGRVHRTGRSLRVEKTGLEMVLRPARHEERDYGREHSVITYPPRPTEVSELHTQPADCLLPGMPAGDASAAEDVG